MGTWFWANIPFMVLFVACWAGIPLWLTLTHWHRETEAKHAEIAAEMAVAQQAAEREIESPVYAQTAGWR